MLSSPVPRLTPEIFAPVPTKTLKVWATTLGEEHSSSAFLCLLIFGVPPVVSWGIGSDLLLSQKGRFFCDLGVQDGLMGPKPSGRRSPSTESNTTCKQGNSRPRSQTEESRSRLRGGKRPTGSLLANGDYLYWAIVYWQPAQPTTASQTCFQIQALLFSVKYLTEGHRTHLQALL